MFPYFLSQVRINPEFNNTDMETFDQLINSGTTIMVDFYADWCGPCKTMEPIVKDAMTELSGKARIIKINIDKNESTAARYNIRAVPTFVIFKNGKEMWRHSGMLDKNTFVRQVLSF
jgi:thioredoxin 1